MMEVFRVGMKRVRALTGEQMHDCPEEDGGAAEADAEAGETVGADAEAGEAAEADETVDGEDAE